MRDFKKQIVNPLEIMESYWPHIRKEHITYDQNMKGSDREYWRIEQCGHDGTAYFTIQLFEKLLIPLINKTTFYKRTEPNWNNVKDIKYIIGNIKHSIVYGDIDLRCGRFPGMLERVRLPVKCEYVYK